MTYLLIFIIWKILKMSIKTQIGIMLQFYPEDKRKQIYVQRTEKLSRECGCSMGAKFTVLSIIVTLVHLFFFSNFQFNILFQILKYLLFIFVLSLLGKLFGLAIAKIRLYLIYRSLIQQQKLKQNI